jgi:lipopolysaccharide biosynthesis protein
VQAAGVEPLAHFLNKGWEEGRDPNPYFKIDWYIANNPAVLAQNINPLLHYLEQGWKNRRDPSPKFSIQHYFDNNPYAEKTVEPLSQWVQEKPGEKYDNYRNEYLHWPITYISSDIRRQPSAVLGKIAVQLHAFYLDKLDILLAHLRYLPARFDLLVSTDTPEHAREIETLVAQSGLDCGLDVRCSENRGRDVAPLICLFGRKLLDYDYALHIHSKKSANVKTDVDFGHRWLMHNLDYLAHNKEYVQGIFSLLSDSPKCGVLVPKPWKSVRHGVAWTTNRPHAKALLKRLHLPLTALNTQPLMFPVGTMFWFRPAALQPLLASDLRYDDFPPEPLPNDGTLAHAIERSILYIALSQGYHSLVIAPVIRQPALK